MRPVKLYHMAAALVPVRIVVVDFILFAIRSTRATLPGNMSTESLSTRFYSLRVDIYARVGHAYRRRGGGFYLN